MEDLRCYFLPADQALIKRAQSVKTRSAEVLNVYIDVEPVSFNRGYYSCDLTFFFLVEFDLFITPHAAPSTVRGIAYFNKKVILYGSDGNVKVFSNNVTLEDAMDMQMVRTQNTPRCVVQSVDPIPLSARIGEIRDCYESSCCIPNCICGCLGGQVMTELENGTPTIFVTLGLFTIVQLVRNVQMLIPVYDFCIPEKQCDDTTDHPCDVFRKIEFPTDEFFPPRQGDCPDHFGCGTGC
ncbi:MAG: hypothetical protein IIX73_02920 [Clostridia bacterium]|nr:hypothetical protein [Clostridia bacterium]MBQ2274456.1 hypothetical protein [Clostridia bacterium]MBQ5900560.1 hypothetical protein [Clostridia bacterium]